MTFRKRHSVRRLIFALATFVVCSLATAGTQAAQPTQEQPAERQPAQPGADTEGPESAATNRQQAPPGASTDPQGAGGRQPSESEGDPAGTQSDGEDQAAGKAGSSKRAKEAQLKRLLWAEGLLLGLVLLVLPIGAWWSQESAARDERHSSKQSGHSAESTQTEKRGLGLPRGSVRSLLALLIVGSTFNFLLFGSGVADDKFNQILSVLSTLSASVMGFYFGGRTATKKPDEQ